MSISTQCLDCKHYTSLSTCDAFPDGIPQEIFDGRVIHDVPYGGDGGVMYDPIDTELSADQMVDVVKILGDKGLLKNEKGVKMEWRTVTRGGTTFKQRFRVGQKESDNDGVIDKWLAEKIEPIKTNDRALNDEFDRIKLITSDAMSKHTAKEYFDSLLNHSEYTVRGCLVHYLDDNSRHKLVNDESGHVRFAVAHYSNNPETIKVLANDEELAIRSIVKDKYYTCLIKHLSEDFLSGKDIDFDDKVKNAIKTMGYEDRDNIKAVHKGLDSLYSSDEKMDKFNIYSKEEWLQSSNNVGAGVLKHFMTKIHDGTEIRHHDAVNLKDAEVISEYLDMIPARLNDKDIINYIKLQQKLTKKLLDIRFPDQDEFVVYRGTTKRECGDTDAKVGDEVKIEQNPISSWTLGKETAQKFAEDENGVVIKMTVSKDDIWSSFLTHSYSSFEQEMVVIGKEGTTAEIVEFGTTPASHGGMFTTGQDIEDEDYEYEDEEGWY